MASNKDWIIMSGGKTFVAYMIKSCPDIPYIEDQVGEDISNNNPESPITMGTKNVVYLSDEGTKIKVYVKMLDKDYYTTHLILREPDYNGSIYSSNNNGSGHTWRRTNPKGNTNYRAYWTRVYDLQLNLNLNTYYINKSSLKRTRGMRGILDRKRNGDCNFTHIDHTIRVSLCGKGPSNLNVLLHVNGRVLNYTEQL